jgi:hypothetical protein
MAQGEPWKGVSGLGREMLKNVFLLHFVPFEITFRPFWIAREVQALKLYIEAHSSLCIAKLMGAAMMYSSFSGAPASYSQSHFAHPTTVNHINSGNVANVTISNVNNN